MKLLLLSITILFAVKLSAQSNEEGAVLSLSKKIFVWEVDNKIDSLENRVIMVLQELGIIEPVVPFDIFEKVEEELDIPKDGK
jgi:hypothetical protein